MEIDCQTDEQAVEIINKVFDDELLRLHREMTVWPWDRSLTNEEGRKRVIKLAARIYGEIRNAQAVRDAALRKLFEPARHRALAKMAWDARDYLQLQSRK